MATFQTEVLADTDCLGKEAGPGRKRGEAVSTIVAPLKKEKSQLGKALQNGMGVARHKKEMS